MKEKKNFCKERFPLFAKISPTDHKKCGQSDAVFFVFFFRIGKTIHFNISWLCNARLSTFFFFLLISLWDQRKNGKHKTVYRFTIFHFSMLFPRTIWLSLFTHTDTREREKCVFLFTDKWCDSWALTIPNIDNFTTFSALKTSFSFNKPYIRLGLR